MLRPPLHLQSGAGIFLPTICGIVQSIRQRKDGQGLGTWYCPSDRCPSSIYGMPGSGPVSFALEAQTVWGTWSPSVSPATALPTCPSALGLAALETVGIRDPLCTRVFVIVHRDNTRSRPKPSPGLRGPQSVDATGTDHRECSDQKEREVLAGGQEIFPTGGGKQWPSPGAKATILELRGELV